MKQRTMRYRVATLVLAATCLVGGAACGGDDEPAEADETTTTTVAPETTAPPATLTPEQEVEGALQEWTVVMEELLTVEPNPDDPRLAQLILEPQLTEIRNNLAELRATNQIYETGAESTFEITETDVEPTLVTARVTVCNVGADRLVDRDTGAVVAEGISTGEDVYTFRRETGHWMLADVTNIRSWEGATQCGA